MPAEPRTGPSRSTRPRGRLAEGCILKQPLSSETATFPCAPVSVRDARRFLLAFLSDANRGDLRDAAELALSEVVTNAVLHAHTGFEVTCSLGSDRALRVEVTDANPQLPSQREYAEQATTGRGMELVSLVTADCGVWGREDGKTVWFVVQAVDGADGGAASGWDISEEGAAQAADSMTIKLLGLPPTLWLAAREHHDAILRELALHAFEHPDLAPPPDRMAAADHARPWISERVLAELGRRVASDAAAHRLLPDGHPSPLPDTPRVLDLDVPVPIGAADAFAALQDVLDSAERLAAAGQLLARPGLPEIVAVRDWACEQAIAQHRGVMPTAWPGTEQERFTVGGGKLIDSALPEWDASAVTEAAGGAIAADDANRIIAVSRFLADALGWTVAELVGRRVVAVIPPELREAHVAGFTRHLTTGETHAIGVPLRLPCLRRDGSRINCDFLIEQFPAPFGRTVYVAWIQPEV